MSGEKSEAPKEIPESAAPPAYSTVTPAYGYNQQNQPLMGQQYQGQAGQYPPAAPQQGYVPYPGQQVVYGQPQAGTNVIVAYPGQPIAAGQAPPDYFTQAIFVTLCCFWPTGIFAIMRASDARSAVARGDLASAQSYSRSAKFMINVSIGVGILSIVLACVFIGIYVGVILNNIDYHNDND